MAFVSPRRIRFSLLGTCIIVLRGYRKRTKGYQKRTRTKEATIEELIVKMIPKDWTTKRLIYCVILVKGTLFLLCLIWYLCCLLKKNYRVLVEFYEIILNWISFYSWPYDHWRNTAATECIFWLSCLIFKVLDPQEFYNKKF